jgi:hypothetical protein
MSDDSTPLDSRVRAAFEAPPAVSERVAVAALATAAAQRRIRPVPIAAVLLVAVAVFWLATHRRANDARAERTAEPALRIFNHGDIVGVFDLRHRSSISSGSRRPAAGPRRLVIAQGGDS